jgi:N-acetyl sugar amidotransferase
MDTTDPDIVFDADGVCSNCHRYDEISRARLIPMDERPARLRQLVDEIKRKGKKKKYDCIIGVSGGVDSTYVAYLVKELGLRPLAVHFDNGWNSELAVSNIEKILKKLDIDLYTHVVDWEEFKDLQVSFLRASTPDAEVPTDHAINALLFKTASKFGVSYIINGQNLSTESILPVKWGYGYYDATYVKDVHKKFGKVPLKTTPLMGLAELFYYMQVKKIRLLQILNYVDYNKAQVMELLKEKLGWTYYGGKHYESIYTRFFQAYILPRKFNIDKRKAHLSSLIHSGQITRAEALEELKQDVAPADVLQQDKEYVIKKLGFTDSEFENIMKQPCKTFLDYKTQYRVLEKAKQYRKYFKFG